MSFFFCCRKGTKSLPLLQLESTYITSLQQLAAAYTRRAPFACITGDAIRNGRYRMELKAQIARELIKEIQSGRKDLRIALAELTVKYALGGPEEFLAGNTAKFLENEDLFELLNTPSVSSLTITHVAGDSSSPIKVGEGWPRTPLSI